jgi:hypothetical protein
MVMRAIREGVSHDGRALFPYMPYPFYRSMADDDVRAVVAYLRTLPPVKRRMPVSQLDFPLSLFINFAPKPVLAPVPVPDPKDSIATGKYFVTIGGCIECHTPKDDKGRKIKGKELSGGAVYKLRTFSVEAPNLTAKPGTFVGQATRDEFIGRFKDFEGYRQAPKPAREGVNSIMPWPAYGGLTRDDLGAIYDYLKTVPPQ